MKILYDELGFFETHGGVSRYFTQVMRNLPADCQWLLSTVRTRNVYLMEPPFNIPRADQVVQDFIHDTLRGHSFPGVSHVYKTLAALCPRRFPSAELANERSRRRLLREGDFDIYHTTSPHPMFNSWRSVVGRKPLVVTLHDFIPELIANNTRVRLFRARMLRDATKIIAVSESTKRDAIRLYGVPEEKITVIYHGYDMVNANDALPVDLDAKWGLPEKGFVLFVGKRGGYKNFDWMVRALVPFLKDGLKLFCTGAPFSLAEKAMLANLGVSDRVVQSFVTDVEMKALFKSAAAFVYPSRYEGFGLPILDAFAAGCPMLLSNASCFPEIGGDAALYFQLDDEGDFRRQFSCAIDPVFMRTRIRNGRERVHAFSWRKCAEQTTEVYGACMS